LGYLINYREEAMRLNYHLVILGRQGSGKGTQANFLSETLKMPILGAGDLIRAKMKENSPLAKEIRVLHDAGKLIPHSFLEKIILEAASKIPQDKTIIFEGYPRAMEQVPGFYRILKTRKIQKFKVILLEIREKTVYQRINGRRVCVDCGAIFFPPLSLQLKHCPKCGGELVKRSDDSVETIRARLDVFQRETQPVIDYFKEQGFLIQVDGEQSIEEVSKTIMRKLGVAND